MATSTRSPAATPARATVALWTPIWKTPLYFMSELR
jgi:hypothetical protein